MKKHIGHLFNRSTRISVLIEFTKSHYTKKQIEYENYNNSK